MKECSERQSEVLMTDLNATFPLETTQFMIKVSVKWLYFCSEISSLFQNILFPLSGPLKVIDRYRNNLTFMVFFLPPAVTCLWDTWVFVKAR